MAGVAEDDRKRIRLPKQFETRLDQLVEALVSRRRKRRTFRRALEECDRVVHGVGEDGRRWFCA